MPLALATCAATLLMGYSGVTPETTILAAICLPLAGALAIALAGRIQPNLRESVTLVTAEPWSGWCGACCRY